MIRPRTSMRTRIAVAALTLLALLLAPTFAFAHIERASYWPDPAPDTSISPAAGGEIPKIRSLASALSSAGPGKTRVVCKDDSLKLLARSIRKARRGGFDVRPTVHKTLSAARAAGLQRLNKRLAKRCRYHEIQPAVTDSGNDDRVVIMPGLYTEPSARSQPTNDPRCANDRILNDKGEPAALSYAYQSHCPNDQNLIAVLGRALGSGKDPQPPLEDRRGIPNVGGCLRCNLQIEGSGVSSDDVIIDGGRVESGNGGPIGAVKDVGIRVDRADGFVLRKVTVRHVREHAVYVLESDGYMLDNFKTYYAGEYGVLTFVEDHGVMQNCEAAGSGDSGLYPGAGAEGGDQRRPGTAARYTQQVRYCDSHHNSSGYSGTDGNSTWVHHNNFYGNALGFTTDVFTAPGHPGFPQDSDLIEDNNFYSNNFNPYVKGSDVKPSVPVPVGTGLWIAGGNENVVRNNHFWDNRRRGTMLFAVPDATVCAPGIGKPVTDCDPTKLSTSYNNRFYGNVMGQTTDGEYKPNGVDFWWDSFLGNSGNCWYGNAAAPGRSVHTEPGSLPGCNAGRSPGQSVGTTMLLNEAELLGCFGAIASGGYDSTTCPWFVTPAKPGTTRAASQKRAQRAAQQRVLADPESRAQVCAVYGKQKAPACE